MLRRTKKQKEVDALSKMEMTPDLLNFIKNYKEEDQRKDILAIEAAKVFSKKPSKVIFTDEVFSKFLKSLKVSAKKEEILEARLRAISFLNYHFPSLEHIDDSLLANLQVLLLTEKHRGIKQGRREEVVKAKKRK